MAPGLEVNLLATKAGMAISSGVLKPTPPSFIPQVAWSQALSDREPPRVSPKLFRRALVKSWRSCSRSRSPWSRR
eukprot:15379260-Heterocapsa_arctica.AAC.1